MVGKRPDLDENTIKRIKEKLCKFNKEERLKIVELYKIHSATQIAKLLNTGCNAIQNTLCLEGVKIRNMKEAQNKITPQQLKGNKKTSTFMKENNPMKNKDVVKKHLRLLIINIIIIKNG